MSTESQLTLPDELSIANATEWKKRLSDLLHQNPPISLNASALSRVDTAAVQLLLAFVTEAKKADVEFTWVEPSDALKTTAKCLGLSASLVLE